MLLFLEDSVILWEALCHLMSSGRVSLQAVSIIHACQCWLQGHEPDRYITPPKRTKIQPYAARKGGWVTVEQMEITNGDNKHEAYKAGESVFVLGNAEQPYDCGEPLCILCDQPSEAQEPGSDLLECDRCMGAVHFHCAALTQAPKVSIMQDSFLRDSRLQVMCHYK